MSLKVYSVAPELDGSTGSKLKAARVKLTLAAFRNGKRIYKNARLPILAETEAGLVTAMVSLIEKIESISVGKVVSVEMELGHYRYDEQLPELVGLSRTAWCNFETIDGHKLKIVVPFAKPATDEQIEAAFADFCATDETSKDGTVGYVRWDQGKTTLVTDQALMTTGGGVVKDEKTARAPKVAYVDAPGVSGAEPYLGDADNQ